MKNRFAKRTDKNQSQIVEDLRARGVQVVITNFGQDFPDLLCSVREVWVLIEVKEKDGSLDRGQLEFIRDAKGYVAVVTDSTEAYQAALGNDVISRAEKERIATWLILNPNQESLSIRKFRSLTSNEKQKEQVGSRGKERSSATSSTRV